MNGEPMRLVISMLTSGLLALFSSVAMGQTREPASQLDLFRETEKSTPSVIPNVQQIRGIPLESTIDPEHYFVGP
ncbi:MAG: hypothetical protein OEM41_10450, partial [Ignavibacteria bacterium]|nr:hypothetical protein [Ignavibacteria bacterium]